MRPIHGPAAVLAALLITGTPALAQAPTIVVHDAWSRAAGAGQVGVVYLTIEDHGGPDRLIGVASPVAGEASLHETVQDHGIMKMRTVPAIPIEDGQPVTLAPGGQHIMLMHLKQALKQGDQIPVTLTFEHAGAVSVTATVTKAGGGMPAMTMPAGHRM